MIPRAKKNLHECEYHLNKLLSSRYFEEVEINFAAFIRSARNVSWVLNNEFNKHLKFIEWYGDPKNPKKGTKAFEMQNDDLCKFFRSLRNSIEKEGINGLNCSTIITSLDTSSDMIDKPPNSSLIISNKGIYYLLNQGTPQEDLIPARTKGNLTTHIVIQGAPRSHLKQIIQSPDLITLSKLYYLYLKNLIEEWVSLQLS